MRPLQRFVALIAVVAALVTSEAVALPPRAARADTIPLLTAVSPSVVAAGASSLALDLTGEFFDVSMKVIWRGVQYPVTVLSSTHATATIPGSALSISELFLTVPVDVTTLVPNPQPVTIVSPNVTSAQGAIAGAG